MTSSSNPTPQKFLVTTPGISATRWLCFALKQHPDVFAAHGKHPLDSVMTGDVNKEYADNDIKSFTEGNIMADFYNKSSLTYLFRKFKKLMPQAKALGNVHGFTIGHLINKKISPTELANINIINVLRHPVNYINSHTALVKKAANFEQLREHYFGNFWKSTLEEYPELHLFDNIPHENLIPFAVSCYSVSNLQHDIGKISCKHMRMEDLVSDVLLLKLFCEKLTGLEYEEQALLDHIQSGNINKHQPKKHSSNPQEIFNSWKTWQQDIAIMLFPQSVMLHFQDHGYDVGMLNIGCTLTPETQGHHSDVKKTSSSNSTSISYNTKTNYNSTAETFINGNYVQTLLDKHEDTWEYAASLGLIGKTEQAIKLLEKHTHDEATFYKGVIHWIAGHDTKACNYLNKTQTEHAKNLLALIKKPQINVLAQLPWGRVGASDYIGNLKDKKFNLQQVSFDKRDIPNRPYADALSFIDSQTQPDFYLANMVEWQTIPPNIQDLPCPIIGHTADYDLHIQKAYPWLKVFDTLIVSDHTEFSHLNKIVDKKSYTFPKVFGLTKESYDKQPAGERDVDVFLSGSVMHSYHPDKCSMLMQSLQASESKNPFIVNGFTGFENYIERLNRAKCSVTSVRHSGAMPTRGLQALSNGCAVVVQKDCTLSLFVGEDEGVFEYNNDAHSLEEQINNIIKNWDEIKEKALKGAKTIRNEFPLSVVSSQYLRFLTFVAASPRKERKKETQEQLFQTRYILNRGWKPNEEAITQLTSANINKLLDAIGKKPETRQIIDLTREMVLWYAGVMTNHPGKHLEEVGKMKTDAFNMFMQGIKMFKGSLPLSFNFIRTAMHFGNTDMVTLAVTKAEKILLSSPSDWEIDPMEDIFPWDFFNMFFDYRQYLDEVCEQLPSQKASTSKLSELLFSSIHYYLSFYKNSVENCQKAVYYNASFAPYKYRLARLYLERNNKEDIPKAGELLVDLCSNSFFFSRAFNELEWLHKSKKYTAEDFDLLELRINRLNNGYELAKKEKAFIRPNDDFEVTSLQPECPSPICEQIEVRLNPDYVKHLCREITLVCPTFNKPDFLSRMLRFYSSIEFSGQIIIADSSSVTISKMNRRLLEKYNSTLNLHYEHIQQTNQTHEGFILSQISDLITTPFTTYCDSNSFLLPEGLAQCIDFLKKENHYSMACGRKLNIQLDNGSPTGKLIAAQAPALFELTDYYSLHRWQAYTSSMVKFQTRVNKTEDWKAMYKNSGKIPCNYLGAMFVPESISAIQGRMKCVNTIMELHQLTGTPKLNWDKTSFFDLINSPEWSISIAETQKAIVTALKNNSNDDNLNFEQIVKIGLWQHVSGALNNQLHNLYTGKQQSDGIPPEQGSKFLIKILEDRAIRKQLLPIIKIVSGTG